MRCHVCLTVFHIYMYKRSHVIKLKKEELTNKIKLSMLIFKSSKTIRFFPRHTCNLTCHNVLKSVLIPVFFRSAIIAGAKVRGR